MAPRKKAGAGDDMRDREEKLRDHAKIVPVLTLKCLKQGDRGRLVAVMQALLAARGYSLGWYGLDGDFGLMTACALRGFQLDHGLEATGECGPETWGKLISEED